MDKSVQMLRDIEPQIYENITSVGTDYFGR